MAILTRITILFVGALCLLSIPSLVRSAAPQFFVQGEVYCEVCRANFINRLSELMPGARVRLECRGEEEHNVTYSVEGETNDKGVYRLPVLGDHDEEQCEVTLVKSSRADCSEMPEEGWAKKPSSKVTITKNSGIHDDTRNANPLSFTVKKTSTPQCQEIFKELEVDQDL